MNLQLNLVQHFLPEYGLMRKPDFIVNKVKGVLDVLLVLLRVDGGEADQQALELATGEAATLLQGKHVQPLKR